MFRRTAGALLLSLISAPAFASPGCDALQQTPVTIGPVNGTASFPGIVFSTAQFSAGDRITATITGGSANTVNLNAIPPGAPFAVKTPVAPGDVISGTIPQSGVITVQFYHNTAVNLSVTITCGIPASGTNPKTDSQKIRAVQIIGSTIAAQNSGTAISGAIDEAIGDAFGSGSFFTAGPNNVTFNFTADSKSDVQRRTDEAFAALGYDKGMVTKAPSRALVPDRRWSLWVNVRGSGFDRDDANSFDGTQVNVTGGFGYKLTPDLLVGLFGGYETFDYDMRALAGKFDGNGGTAGGYASWRLMPGLRWDAALGWSASVTKRARVRPRAPSMARAGCSRPG